MPDCEAAARERRVLAVDLEGDEGLAVRRQRQVRDRADRRAVQLDLIAGHELVRIDEVGLDRVAAPSAEDQEADEHGSGDYRRNSGNPPYTAYRSHPGLVTPPPSARATIAGNSLPRRRRRNVPQ
jgi:hypothetical protein